MRRAPSFCTPQALQALVIGAACLVSLLCASTAGSVASTRVRTLVETRAPIIAFAQGGGQMAWIENPDKLCGELHVRVVATGREARLPVAPAGDCDSGIGVSYFAFDGGRAFWDRSSWGESVCYDSLEAAGLHDRQVVPIAHFQSDADGSSGTPQVKGIAAAGATLLYWTLAWRTYDPWCQESCDVVLGGGSTFRVNGRSSAAFPDVPSSPLLAVAGDRIAVVPVSRRGCACSEYPSWSPDGSSILFDTLHEAPNYELAIVSAEGGKPRQPTVDPRDDVTPAWSPDGTPIAYVGGSAVYVVNADGTGKRKLAAEGSDPAWSPDGTRIAFASCAGVCGISVVDRATASVRQITKAEPEASSPRWSPDEMKVVFVAGAELRIVDAGGGNERKLAAGSSPAWSPDGTSIAYVTSGEVRVVGADGSGDRKLVDGSDPAWSPDGSTIAYAHSDGHDDELYAVAAAGGPPRQLTHDLAIDYAPSWSPDGTWLLFLRASSGYRSEIYVVNADGSGERQLTSLSNETPAVTVDIRTLQGRLVRRLSPGGTVDGVALSGEVVAVLVRHDPAMQLRVYDARSGALRAALPVSRETAEFSAAAGDVVFADRRSIRLFDSRLRRSLTLAAASSTPIGLSIKGGRVAWAEDAGTGSRIRTVIVPAN